MKRGWIITEYGLNMDGIWMDGTWREYRFNMMEYGWDTGGVWRGDESKENGLWAIWMHYCKNVDGFWPGYGWNLDGYCRNVFN